MLDLSMGAFSDPRCMLSKTMFSDYSKHVIETLRLCSQHIVVRSTGRLGVQVFLWRKVGRK